MPCNLSQFIKLALGALSSVLVTFSPAVWAEEVKRWQVNMSPGVTDIGAEIYGLHMAVFWICVVIGVVVFGVMLYSIFAHRKSKGVTAASFHESTKVEVAWTVLPFLILIGLAVPATTTLIGIYDTSDAELDIVVTGYRWYWQYEYLNEDGENVSYFSKLSTPRSEIDNEDPKGVNYLLEVDEPMVIPVGKKVRFLITANDVIHSWWVPELAVKRDAIPGFINETWTRANEVGVYRGQCAELCGKNHGFMPIVVNVVSEEEFADWLQGKQQAAAEIKELMSQNFNLDQLMERGEGIYKNSCMACHGVAGEGGLGKPIAGSAIAMGDIQRHLDVIVNGIASTSMPALGKQLNDVDLAAVTTYQRNAFGNNMGDLVQPIDVYNYKNGQ